MNNELNDQNIQRILFLVYFDLLKFFIVTEYFFRIIFKTGSESFKYDM
jgi:hypothetical protein